MAGRVPGVELEAGLEGLLHISELADHNVENPEEVVKVGDEIEVKILRVDADERKIGLSRKRVEWAEEAEAEIEPAEQRPPQAEVELKALLSELDRRSAWREAFAKSAPKALG